MQNRVGIITGAAGLLGYQFSEALLEAGAKVCLLDMNADKLKQKARKLKKICGENVLAIAADITNEQEISKACNQILMKFGKIDILINNAANNPKVDKLSKINFLRLENFLLANWNQDIAVGLTGAFLCCKVFGAEMARRKRGVIVNIASDLSVIAPDQRIYRDPELPPEKQPVKPVTYSVVKSGLVGLTRYLATYWADSGIRVNALSPGGVYTNQPHEFVERLANLIPMKRMADIDEYKESILFLCSDSSKYMTGQNMIVDGGRTVW